MTPRTLTAAGAAALAAVAVGAASFAPQRLDDATLSRAILYRTLDPTLDMDEAVDLVRTSDAWRSRASEDGTTVAELLADTSVTEEEARAWYDAHRELFGRRAFAEVAPAVHRMARLEKLRDTLESR